MLVRDDRTSVSSLIGFQKISRKQNISVAIFLIRMQKKKEKYSKVSSVWCAHARSIEPASDEE